MFKNEQNIAEKWKNRPKSAVSPNGILFAKRNPVKKRITYKEITLILGILVAIVVSLTLWVYERDQQEQGHSITRPSARPAVVVKTFVKAIADVIF